MTKLSNSQLTPPPTLLLPPPPPCRALPGWESLLTETVSTPLSSFLQTTGDLSGWIRWAVLYTHTHRGCSYLKHLQTFFLSFIAIHFLLRNSRCRLWLLPGRAVTVSERWSIFDIGNFTLVLVTLTVGLFMFLQRCWTFAGLLSAPSSSSSSSESESRVS